MFALFRPCFSLLIVVISLCSAAGARADDLKIGGTGNALGVMRLLADAYMQRHPGQTVTVLPSLGTSGAIKAVPKGALDIGLSSRALKDEEHKTGIVALEFARTPLVFAVSIKTPVTELSLAQIADIYSGRLTQWPGGGGQIRPVLRQAGDDNTLQVRRMSAALDLALIAAEQRPGMPFATNDQEAADKTESIPGALGVTTLSLINAERRSLRALKIDGVEPTPAHASTGRYPYVKPFYLVTMSEPSAPVKRFVSFIQSASGREVLVRAGNWVP